MYCIQNAITKPVTVRKAKDDFKPVQLPFKPSPKGLFIYDSGRFLEGKLMSLKIQTAMAGASKYIDISRFSKRISYLQDFNEISMIPYPHLNTIGFVGVGHKSEYLIWRES